MVDDGGILDPYRITGMVWLVLMAVVVVLVFTFTHSEHGQKRQRPPVVNYIFSN